MRVVVVTYDVDVGVESDIEDIALVEVDIDVEVVVTAVVDNTDGVVVALVMLSWFFGTRMTNFSNRERIIAKIAKMTKEMNIILI